MHAQVITLTIEPRRLPELEYLVRFELLPALRTEPGFSGATSLVEQEQGRVLLILLWETEEEAVRPAPALLEAFSSSTTIWEVNRGRERSAVVEQVGEAGERFARASLERRELAETARRRSRTASRPLQYTSATSSRCSAGSCRRAWWTDGASVSSGAMATSSTSEPVLRTVEPPGTFQSRVVV